MLFSSALILHPVWVSESVSDEPRYRAAIAAKKNGIGDTRSSSVMDDHTKIINEATAKIGLFDCRYV